MKPAKDLNSILQLPLTDIQFALAEHLLTGKFSDSDLQHTTKALRKVVPAEEIPVFDLEADNIAQAVKTGIAPREPNLSTKQLQLLWAANLTNMAVNSNQPLEKTALWKQLLNCDDIKHQKQKHATYMARDQFNPTTRLEWGTPGSMFYFDPAANSINIDLVMSMIGGFDETRSIVFHEIGHSKLTVKFTDKMTEIRKNLETLQKKGESESLTIEEYATLKGLSASWKFMHRVFDEAENSPVNRYTINAAPKFAQGDEASLDHFLNVVETTIARAGAHPLPKDPTLEEKFRNLNRTVRMSLYKNNGLFEDTPEGWKRVGVKTDWIEALPSRPNAKAPTSKEAFRELMELCGGTEGLEHLQPGVLDHMRGAEWLAAQTEHYANKRNAIIEDHLWKRYAEPLVRQMIEQAKQEAQEQAEQAQQQGSGQGGGQIQPGNPVNVDGAGTMEGVKIPSDNPLTENKKNQQKTSNTDKEAGEEKKGGADASDKQSETIKELLEQADKKEQQKQAGEQSSAAQQSEASPSDAEGGNGHGAGMSQKRTLPKMGDYGNYQQQMEQFLPEIAQARRLIDQIQERQAQRSQQITPEYTALPKGGNMRLFKPRRHIELAKKVFITQQPITNNDINRFETTVEKITPASIDLVLMIDGSASMREFRGGYTECSPIEACTNSACIISEAARKDNRNRHRKQPGGDVNVWTVAWGNDPPLIVSRPGDSPEAIGKAIDGMRDGYGWGTKLAPAILHTTKALANCEDNADPLAKTEKADPQKPVGFTHYLVYSDGDIQDGAKAFDNADKLLTNNRHATFDVIVISSMAGSTPMDRVVQKLQEKYGESRVKTIACTDPQEAHALTLTLLRERMLALGKSKAIPFSEREKSLRKAVDSMQQQSR